MASTLNRSQVSLRRTKADFSGGQRIKLKSEEDEAPWFDTRKRRTISLGSGKEREIILEDPPHLDDLDVKRWMEGDTELVSANLPLELGGGTLVARASREAAPSSQESQLTELDTLECRMYPIISDPDAELGENISVTEYEDENLKVLLNLRNSTHEWGSKEFAANLSQVAIDAFSVLFERETSETKARFQSADRRDEYARKMIQNFAAAVLNPFLRKCQAARNKPHEDVKVEDIEVDWVEIKKTIRDGLGYKFGNVWTNNQSKIRKYIKAEKAPLICETYFNLIIYERALDLYNRSDLIARVVNAQLLLALPCMQPLNDFLRKEVVDGFLFMRRTNLQVTCDWERVLQKMEPFLGEIPYVLMGEDSAASTWRNYLTNRDTGLAPALILQAKELYNGAERTYVTKTSELTKHEAEVILRSYNGKYDREEDPECVNRLLYVVGTLRLTLSFSAALPFDTSILQEIGSDDDNSPFSTKLWAPVMQRVQDTSKVLEPMKRIEDKVVECIGGPLDDVFERSGLTDEVMVQAMERILKMHPHNKRVEPRDDPGLESAGDERHEAGNSVAAEVPVSRATERVILTPASQTRHRSEHFFFGKEEIVRGGKDKFIAEFKENLEKVGEFQPENSQEPRKRKPPKKDLDQCLEDFTALVKADCDALLSEPPESLREVGLALLVVGDVMTEEYTRFDFDWSIKARLAWHRALVRPEYFRKAMRNTFKGFYLSTVLQRAGIATFYTDCLWWRLDRTCANTLEQDLTTALITDSHGFQICNDVRLTKHILGSSGQLMAAANDLGIRAIDIRWVYHKLRQQEGICMMHQVCGRQLYVNPEDTALDHDDKFISVGCVDRRSDPGRLEDGLPSFPSYPCLVSVFREPYSPGLASGLSPQFYNYHQSDRPDRHKPRPRLGPMSSIGDKPWDVLMTEAAKHEIEVKVPDKVGERDEDEEMIICD